MTRVSVAQAQAELSHYLRLAEGGEQVVICDLDVPVAELRPVNRSPETLSEIGRRRSAFGMHGPWISEEALHEALRPMTDDEADRFLETGAY